MEIILFICSAILLLASPSIEVTTSCSIPSVELGQPTNLTCKYSEDINKLRRDFKVEFYFNNQAESTKTVLDCHWFNGALDCDTHECCTFDKNVGNSIQVHFRRITSEYVGKYVCFVLPSSVGSSEFCNFTFKETFTTTLLPPEQLAQEDRTATHSGEGLAALVLIPIAIIIAVVAIVCYRKKGLRRKAKNCLTCKTCKNDTTVKGKQEQSLLPPCDSGNGNITVSYSSKSRTLPNKGVEHVSAITKFDSSKSHTLPNKGENSNNIKLDMTRLLEGISPDVPDTDNQDEIIEKREGQEYKEDEGLREHSVSENTETQIDVTSPVTSDRKENSGSISETENSENIPVQVQLANDSSVVNKESQNAEATGNTAVQEQSA